MHKKNFIMPFGVEGVFKIMEDFHSIEKSIEELFRNKDTYSNYPPSCVYMDLESNTYLIELAVAGWKEEELEVHVDGDVLYIDGSKRSGAVSDKDPRYKIFHDGIAKRNFKKKYTVGMPITNVEVSLEAGIIRAVVSFDGNSDSRKKIEINKKQ